MAVCGRVALSLVLLFVVVLSCACGDVSAKVILHNVSSYDEALSLIDNTQNRLLLLWDPLDTPSRREYTYLRELDLKESVTVYAISVRCPFTSWLLVPLDALAFPSYRGILRNPKQSVPQFDKVDAHNLNPEVFSQILRRFSS